MAQPYDIQVPDIFASFERGRQVAYNRERQPVEDSQRDAVFGQHQQDRELQQVGQLAGYLSRLSPEQRAAAYPSIAAKVAGAVQKYGLPPPPPVWDESHLGELQQLATMFGGQQEGLRPMNVSPGGAIVDPTTGKEIYANTNFAPPRPQQPVWDSARGGWVMPPEQMGPQMPAPGPQQAAGGNFATVATSIAQKYGFQPTSLQRTPDENARLPGAAPNSRHLDGEAIDLSIRGKSPQEIAAISAEMQAAGFKGGIHTKGTAPHLHFERPRGGGPVAAGPMGSTPGFIPVVSPKEGGDESFSQPQEVKGPDGKPMLVQFGNRGSMRPVPGYGVADNSASANKEQMQRERMVAQLSKRLTEEQVPLIETQLGAIEGSLRQYTDAKGGVTKDVPGFGRLDSLVPNFAASTDALDLRQQVQGLANVVLKSRSGAAVTDQELRRFLVEAGNGKLMPESQLVKGIQAMRKWFDAQKINIRGGYSPEVVDAYYGNAPENSGLLGGGAPKAPANNAPAAGGWSIKVKATP